MSIGSLIAPHVPFLRRFARALTGDQAMGDGCVRATLEAIVDNPGLFPADVDPRLALYRTFLLVWRRDTHQSAIPDDVANDEAIAAARLSVLAPQTRQALLLTSMEGFTPEDAAYLLDASADTVEAMVATALSEVERQTQTNVLIIEDEPMIAMDLETIVRDLGHDVSGIAVTHDEAVIASRSQRPGLVLADIQLADDSSGIDAVADILAQFSVPAIFITAFPERLLTGTRPEPTYLITKPFQRTTVKATIAQALFFDRETIPVR